MSFGDPHNPYGQQPAPGQPGYGYPQQAPQGIPPQGGYAYPQQAPQGYPGGPAGYPGGPGGYPGAHMEMPGGAKAARVILFVMGALQALGGLFVIIGGAVLGAALSDSSSSSAEDVGAVAGTAGVILGLLFIGFALWPILTAAKMGKGRGGVRVSGIIYGSLQTLFAVLGILLNLAALGASEHTTGSGGLTVISVLPSLISLALGLTIVIGLAKAGDYFRRPQY
ncbi:MULTISPECIES: hypothetical protein [Streptomyces]|uniref:Integral membrane protein n=1 Tax=Streptomyces virginiae TaxID=1961 RepID=A0ABQ3ND80_STRVG|nr:MULTISPECIES: hypothetical protein [Streptomyces]KOU19169.1 hypothetical protein ADK49_11620 [Streptomyces sp. WM6349]KOU85840.1 hypothetical protein ADK94_14800 [Streptomyces sp. XY593]KOU96622.1 hypothetical protein ADK91_34500 [Streptomyces sp. XY511]KOV44714.1 hypothetical protein ADK98_17680 [Streptomyces sp. H036]MBP2346005.1 hypothetical protein [Streptomyces virginiae]